MMPKYRHVETAEEQHARFVRVLAADVSWWRENAQRSANETLRQQALLVAAGLETVLDAWKRGPLAEAMGEGRLRHVECQREGEG